MSEHYRGEGERHDTAGTGRIVAGRREAASRVASFVRDGVDRANGYVQAWTGVASDAITDATGRPPEAWGRQLRRFVEQSPVKALALAIAAGVLVGRAMRHG
jgi:plasmid stabilization system protein ParE